MVKNLRYLIQPCALCKTIPRLKEHIQENILRALYINCDVCNIHGPFKHIDEFGSREKAYQIAVNQWNQTQFMMLDERWKMPSDLKDGLKK